MSLTLDYDQDNARVEIVVDGLQTAGAVLFTIERSTDQVNWTRVRGAINQAVTDDDPILFFDYEYAPGPGVTNFYRVIGQDGPEFVGVGTHDYHATGSVTPGLPAGVQEGDLLIIWAIAQGASFHIINTPSGWQRLSPLGRPTASEVYAFVKIAESGEVAPTLTGNVSSKLAQMAAFRNVADEVLDLQNMGANDQPGPAGELHFPGVSVPEDFVTVVVLGARGGDWTSVAASTGFTLIDDPSETSGNDLSLAWQYQIQSAAQPIPTDFMAVTGGTSTFGNAGNTVTFPYSPGPSSSTVLFSDSVATPLEVAWLKNPLRPPRNMVVKLGRPTQLRRAARSGLFDIKGRADPIEVTEIRRSIAWVQPFVADSFGESDGLLDLFEPGETLLLHVPGRDDSPGCPPSQDLPGGYIHVGDVVEERSPDKSLPRAFTAPVQKVAGPRPELGYIEPPESSS